MIAVVDYQKGNLLSCERGLVAAGGDARITSDAADILAADALVLPGVGAFADAAATMNELGQMDAIRERVAQGVPFLGICLGLHLMFEEGVEDAPEGAPTKGLGFLPGCVDKMPQTDKTGTPFKVPHVGWNTLEVPAGEDLQVCDGSEALGGVHQASSARAGQPSGLSVRAGLFERLDPPEGLADNDNAFASPLLAGIAPGTYFYFTHSYIAPASAYTVSLTQHSVRFPSVVQAGERVFGTQFHPEKSSDAGAQVLRNFVGIVEAACGRKGA